MDYEDYKHLISELPFGKQLKNAKYLHLDSLTDCSPQLQVLVGMIEERMVIDRACNVIKLYLFEPKISLLYYPDFFELPHPELRSSSTVDFATGKVRKHDYQGSVNPPILHRKEALLPPEHSLIEKFQRLTEAEEAEGLYANSNTIGFKLNWESLLAAKGLAYCGHKLVRIQNQPAEQEEEAAEVQRHKTAIARYQFSKPIQGLIEYGLLKENVMLLDYGCGQGDDVNGLKELGYNALGWDPVYRPEEPKEPAEIVNLGFVLNVIEDPIERAEVLHEAHKLSKKLLVVSTLVANSSTPVSGRPYKDGILTSRNTFQKYFRQNELQQYIEDVLGASAVAVGPGIFYVFRSPSDQQQFLSNRSKRAINWEAISLRLYPVRARPKRPPKEDPYEKHKELLDGFWQRMLDLGRVPKRSEFDGFDELCTALGSANKARRLFVRKFGEDTLTRAFVQRRDDLLVYLALSNFKRKVPFKHLPEDLKTDIKTFLGSYRQGLAEGELMLFAVGNPQVIAQLCDKAGFGHLDDQALYIHQGLIQDLHPILRIYVGCAEMLYGDIRNADVIKIHKRSGKVTLLKYDDFENNPLPELLERVKIDLRRQAVDIFDHQSSEKQQLLYFKERFVGLDHPERGRWEQFSSWLRSLELDQELERGFGPSKQELMAFFESKGLTVDLDRQGECNRSPYILL